MPVKTIYSKKQIEQRLMLKIRMSLLLCKADIPHQFRESCRQRVLDGLRALEDHLSIHHPSEWFRTMFTNPFAYYAGLCWSAELDGPMWRVTILEELPEHKEARA